VLTENLAQRLTPGHKKRQGCSLFRQMLHWLSK
jgi:hypothetical protein